MRTAVRPGLRLETWGLRWIGPLVKRKATVGKAAPWFKLKNLTGTYTWTHRNVRGKPTLLVVGRSRRAAPPCKKWMLELLKRHGKQARVFQVIVIKKAWYHPRNLVLKEIRGFVPDAHHDKTLLEWYTVFSDVWGIPKVDDPFIYLLDGDGVIRHHHRGAASKAALRRVAGALARLSTPSADKRSPR